MIIIITIIIAVILCGVCNLYFKMLVPWLAAFVPE